MKRTATLAIASLALLVALPLLAGAEGAPKTAPAPAATEPEAHETSSEVPELFDFHEPIMKLWHEAWPAKDVATLKSLVPEIEERAAKLAKAKLPGILRDKQKAWDAGIAELMATVGSYKDSAAKGAEQPLLDAAEKLHSQFEKLVRITRPALKEVDAFHQVLYRLYHYDLPKFDMKKVQATVVELEKEMAALAKAKLPDRMKAKGEAFEAKRKELEKAVEDLGAAARAAKDEKTVKAAIETVHSAYQSLDGIF